MTDIIRAYNSVHKLSVYFRDALQQAVINIQEPFSATGNYCTNFRLFRHRYHASVTPLGDNEFAIFLYNGQEPDFGNIIYCKKNVEVSVRGLISSTADFILQQIAVTTGIIKEIKLYEQTY